MIPDPKHGRPPRQTLRFTMPPKHKACGERRCADEAHAMRYVLWLARKTTTPLRVYPCPACAGWHVTSKPTWKDTAA